MVVKNIQIHVENGFASQKIRHFCYLQAKLSSRSLSPPQGRVKLLILKLGRGGLFQTYFKMYCFKSTFLKHVTEEFTFCWKVLLVTLSKNLVATITGFLSLFLNIVINIYIQWHVLYRPEFKVTPITLYFSSTKYKYRIITNVYM